MHGFFMKKLKCSNFSKKTIFIQVPLLEIMIISFGQANLIWHSSWRATVAYYGSAVPEVVMHVIIINAAFSPLLWPYYWEEHNWIYVPYQEFGDVVKDLLY